MSRAPINADVPRRARRRSRTRPVLVMAAACCAGLLGSCSADGSPSALDPRGPGAERIAGLWWFMFWVSAAVVAVVTLLLLVGVIPRRRTRRTGKELPRWTGPMVVAGGVVVPLIVLALLWVFTLRDMAALSTPAERPALTVDVVGHLWWWEVRYPAQGFVTANEIHVPVGRPVQLRLTTDDVIHSFWVPQLTGKTDLIAGRTNSMWIQADRPGTYRGQCAEYCGLQHAHMAFYVVAEPQARFDAWLDRQSGPALTPQSAAARRGEEVFLSAPCAACHMIEGTAADGRVGPDLTHFGSRIAIGAGAVPNTPGNLGGWIVNSQSIKPGNEMPPIPLSGEEVQALIAYLESLK